MIFFNLKVKTELFYESFSDIWVGVSLFVRNDVLNIDGSSGCVVVKLLACGARGTGFDSRSRRYNFRDWLFHASKS